MKKGKGKEKNYQKVEKKCAGRRSKQQNRLHNERKEKESWAIIPIHTDKPEEISQLFSNDWQITLLNDGDSIPLFSSMASKFPQVGEQICVY